MDALEYFEYRLESTKEYGANFRVPIDWQVYGPLFLSLYKAARKLDGLVIPTRYRADVGALAAWCSSVETQMKREANGS